MWVTSGVSTTLVVVNSMAKGQGYGADIPEPIRNGDWIYQSFSVDGVPNPKANLTACFQCHLPFAKDDYLTNLAKLEGKFPTVAQVALKTSPTDVSITGFQFGPAAVKVTQGSRITWTNADDTPHQITLVGGAGTRSDVMLKGQSATMQLDITGNIAYICGLHPTMKGTIEVTPK